MWFIPATRKPGEPAELTLAKALLKGKRMTGAGIVVLPLQQRRKGEASFRRPALGLKDFTPKLSRISGAFLTTSLLVCSKQSERINVRGAPSRHNESCKRNPTE